MSIPFECPNCQRALRLPDDAAGKRIRCPKCQEISRVPDEAVEAEPVAIPGILEEEQEVVAERDDDRRPCPACGEMIIADAAKCRFCGEIFDPELKRLEKKKKRKSSDSRMTGGDWVVAVVCSGIGCIVGIVWMIQGKPKGLKMMGVSIAFAVFWTFVRAAAEMALRQPGR